MLGHGKKGKDLHSQMMNNISFVSVKPCVSTEVQSFGTVGRYEIRLLHVI